jgi:YVTN family beta-propeller protein
MTVNQWIRHCLAAGLNFPVSVRRTRLRTLVPAVSLLALSISASTFGDASATVRPGFLGGGITLLPNGWKIAPVGFHVQVGDLPLNMVESPDGKALIVANNGYATPSLTVVRLSDYAVQETIGLDHAWLGLTWHPDGRRLLVSGAANNTVHELFFDGHGLRRDPDFVLGRPFVRPPADDAREPDEPETVVRPPATPQSFIGGIAVSPDGRTLYAVHVFGQLLSVVDLATGHVIRNLELPAEPYACAVSRDGSKLFVSLWGGAAVLVYDAKTLELIGSVPVGEHPNGLAVTRDGGRLFVACANTNAVWAVDVTHLRATEQISVAVFPNAPPGSTPNSVSLSPDDRRLLVANADNNTVAVVDVSMPERSDVEGFIPTGWYPTDAMFSHDGSRIFVLSGKGLSSAPNPRFRTGPGTALERQYIGGLLTGALSIIQTPDAEQLARLTRTVREITRYTDDRKLAPADAPRQSPVPARVGAPSPIKHVFYVIRENRTYDQVFGDLERGNGDPSLTLFGERVTPNAHALAREFGVLDNFYVDAEVSYDGHAFTTGAYATDFIKKIWPTEYANRGALYLAEGTGQMRNPYGNIAAPPNGYIWDACVRANVSVRSYGEFAHWDEPGLLSDRLAGRVLASPSVPGLEGRLDARYPPWDLRIPDNLRVDRWLDEFKAFEANGSLPSLSIIRIGNDHTNGTRTGAWTPRAMVAENDLALGRLVEAISHSRYWRDSAIFVLEDDAQNGPDHIDAHRSPALVISPYSRRRGLDSTLYTTSGVLRTIELILGLPPMSQYDAAASPLYGAFQSTPTLAAFDHVEAQISTNERNGPNAYGAAASLALDFSEPDRVPDRLLSEIVWRSVKGADSPMPPPVRSAFVRRHGADDDD